jgi:integrase/recombinase XerD
VAKYREQAHITKKVSCHGLRHTFATQKSAKGLSPYQLQAWLGHESLAITQIYVHLGRQNAQRVMEQTSHFFADNKLPPERFDRVPGAG